MSKICTKILHVLLVDLSKCSLFSGMYHNFDKKKKNSYRKAEESHESMTREEIDKKTGSGSRAEISVLGSSHLLSVTCTS